MRGRGVDGNPAIEARGEEKGVRGHCDCNCKTRSTSRRYERKGREKDRGRGGGITCELRHGRDSAVSPFSDATSIYYIRYTPSEIEQFVEKKFGRIHSGYKVIKAFAVAYYTYVCIISKG